MLYSSWGASGAIDDDGDAVAVACVETRLKFSLVHSTNYDWELSDKVFDVRVYRSN